MTCTKADEHFVLRILLIIGGWSSVMTCILGLFANTFSIIVLMSKRMRILSTNIYLIALAIVNLLWLIFFFLFYALRLTLVVPDFLSENHGHVYSIYNQIFHRLSPYIIPLMNTLQLCIIYYTVAVSIDRYLYVTTGFNKSLYCTVKNALRTILCLTIFVIIFILPHWFKHRVITRLDTANHTHYKMSYTHLGQQKLFQQIVNIYTYIPIVHVIPLLTLIIINILTVRRLVEYRGEHRRLLSQSIRNRAMLVDSPRHHHVTVMLIGVVVLFFICRIPMLINQLCNLQYICQHHLCSSCRIQRVFSTCANFMQTINSNGNFIIYLTCCRNFREASKELWQQVCNFRRFLTINPSLFHGRSRASTHSTDG